MDGPTPTELRNLVQLVEAERTARNLSNYAIAKAAGVAMDAVRRFFRGYDATGPGRVRLDTAMRIAAACGLQLGISRRSSR